MSQTPAQSDRFAASSPPAGSSGLSYPLRSGGVCRSWDDFLTLSAQRWEELRDDLTSGRLGAALARSGHAVQVPPADAPGSPDDRLDAWLGGLPVAKPRHPELDVRPARLDIAIAEDGTTTGNTLTIRNVGYRLLRVRASIAPETTDWSEIPGELWGGEVAVADRADLTIRIDPRRRNRRANAAEVVLESNGGSRRVPIFLANARQVRGRVSEHRPVTVMGIAARLALGAIGGGLLRLGIAGLGSLLDPGIAGVSDRPALGPRATIAGFLAIGLLTGLSAVIRRAGPAWAGAVAGAVAGAMLGDVALSAGLLIEPWLASSTSWPTAAAAALWTMCGLAIAVVLCLGRSMLYRPSTENGGPP